MVAEAPTTSTPAPSTPDALSSGSPLVPDAECLVPSASSAQCLVPSPPPPLSAREKLLLATFIALRYSLPDLILKADMTPDEVIAFTTSPSIAAHIAATQAFTSASLTLRATEARRTAIDLLEETARKLDDPIEKRRAATSLFRATAAPIIPVWRDRPLDGSADRRAGPADSANARSSRRSSDRAPVADTPSPAYAPRPDLSSRQVAEIITEAIRFPDRPDAATGHATLAQFCDSGARVNSIPIPPDTDTAIEVLRFAHLKSCTVSTGASAPDKGQFTSTPDGVESALHTVQVQTGPRSIAIRIRLTRSANSRAPNCWLITELSTAPVERPP